MLVATWKGDPEIICFNLNIFCGFKKVMFFFLVQTSSARFDFRIFFKVLFHFYTLQVKYVTAKKNSCTGVVDFHLLFSVSEIHLKITT